MPTTITTHTVNEVVEFLEENEVVVLGYTQGDVMVDGEVELKDKVYVQVGQGYMAVSEVITDHDGRTLINDIGMPSTLKDLLKIVLD